MTPLRLSAKMESFELFRSFVLGRVKLRADLEEIIPQIELVLEEVLINVFNYAYPEGEGEVELDCRAGDSGSFCLTVRDWGRAFNPLDQAAPDLQADISHRNIGGLGIHLVKQMVHHAGYERKEGSNVLTLCFIASP
ncbi:MAG: ATP-binding protein [Syntrophobacteraceae bacterium]